jgi:hypothetical protein
MTSNDEHVVLLTVIRVLLAQSECFYGVLSGFAAQPSGFVFVSRLLGGREIPNSDSVTLLVFDKKINLFNIPWFRISSSLFFDGYMEIKGYINT